MNVQPLTAPTPRPPVFDPTKFANELAAFHPEKPAERGDFSPSDVSLGAHDFMKKMGLFGKVTEGTKNGVTTQWKATKVVKFGGHNLVVMSPESKIGNGPGLSGEAFDVVVADRNPRTGKVMFSRFEDVFSVPPTLRVAIGNDVSAVDDQFNPTGKLRSDLYYVELNSKPNPKDRTLNSVSGALKAMYARIVYAGFSGDPAASGPAPFDPTPGRTWKINRPVFDLHRGGTAEGLDVDPHFFDEDFAGTFRGCGGHVAPWGSAKIRRVFDGSEWKDVLLEPTRA